MPYLASDAWEQPKQSSEGSRQVREVALPIDQIDSGCDDEEETASTTSETPPAAADNNRLKDRRGSVSSMYMQRAYGTKMMKSKYIRRGRSMDLDFADGDIRRAVPITSVLSLFGAVLGSSKGSSRTFDMSRPVERLDVFISHNWSTRRMPKFLTLAYHFNFIPTMVLCALLNTAFVLVVNFRVVSVPYRHESEAMVVDDFTAMCTVVTGIIFPMMLFFGHDVWGCCRMRRCFPLVFLDKICIHQVDPELQRKGIEGLSAFLEASNKMLIVYTSTYLQRLWTVYELATMLVLRDNPDITVLPTELVNILLNGWVMVITFLLLNLAASRWQFDFFIAVERVFIGLVTIPFMMHLRHWARVRSEVTSMISGFSIRKSVCAVESDRKTVYGNVCVLMRVFGYVTDAADDDAALDAFDQLARQLVPLHLEKSWGRSGLPWRCAFGLSPIWLAVMADVLCSEELWAASASRIISHISIWLTLALVATPLWACFAAWIAGLRIGLTGLKDKAYLCVAWVIACSAALGMYMGCMKLWKMTWDDPNFVFIVPPLCCVAISLMVQVWFCQRKDNEHEQERIKEEVKEKHLRGAVDQERTRFAAAKSHYLEGPRPQKRGGASEDSDAEA